MLYFAKSAPFLSIHPPALLFFACCACRRALRRQRATDNARILEDLPLDDRHHDGSQGPRPDFVQEAVLAVSSVAISPLDPAALRGILYVVRPYPMAKLTDRDLVDRARQGDAEAFGQLVRRHQQRIHRLAIHMLRDRAEAEDVTQETFIRAYQALPRFDGRSEPYTWFYRITVNLSLNTIRSRKSSRTTASSDDPRLDGLLAEKRPSAMADPPGDASRKQLYAALCEGIDGLSDTLRTTLILVCVDGRSHEEASEILGAPEGTIAWRVHEARRKLREFLTGKGFDPDGDAT
jgi:RNA polymerase sigma-70 factor (ECF subfamily)